MKVTIGRGLVAALAGVSLASCASTGPTQELLDARRAYDQARVSEARSLAPHRLLSAKEALDSAERVHDAEPGSSRERSYAYVAVRRAQLAQEYGELSRLHEQQAQADEIYVKTQDRLRRAAARRATGMQAPLGDQRWHLASSQSEFVSRVHGESRDAVITLDGGALFVRGKPDILPSARQKLNDVANALKHGEGEQAIWVKDYSDSLASSHANRRLSQQRAEAIRSYLVVRGVRPEFVTAQGKGERNRFASSDTAEGRANHEHVEIVVLSNASISRQ